MGQSLCDLPGSLPHGKRDRYHKIQYNVECSRCFRNMKEEEIISYWGEWVKSYVRGSIWAGTLKKILNTYQTWAKFLTDNLIFSWSHYYEVSTNINCNLQRGNRGSKNLREYVIYPRLQEQDCCTPKPVLSTILRWVGFWWVEVKLGRWVDFSWPGSWQLHIYQNKCVFVCLAFQDVFLGIKMGSANQPHSPF